jgi:hypothetical protein
MIGSAGRLRISASLPPSAGLPHRIEGALGPGYSRTAAHLACNAVIARETLAA